MAGRPSWDGARILRAGKLGDIAVEIYRSHKDGLAERETFTVTLDQCMEAIQCLDEDSKGRIQLALQLLVDRDKASQDVAMAVLVIDEKGKVLKRMRLCTQGMPHEIYKPIKVSPEGKIVQMDFGTEGLFVRNFEP